MNAMYSVKGRKRSPLTSLEMISDRYAAAGWQSWRGRSQGDNLVAGKEK